MIDGNWTRLGGAGKNLLSSTPKQQCFPGSCSRFRLYNAQRRAPLVWKDTWNIRKVLERWIAGAQATSLFFTVSSLLNKRSQAFWALFGCVKQTPCQFYASATRCNNPVFLRCLQRLYIIALEPQASPRGEVRAGHPKPNQTIYYCHILPYISISLLTLVNIHCEGLSCPFLTCWTFRLCHPVPHIPSPRRRPCAWSRINRIASTPSRAPSAPMTTVETASIKTWWFEDVWSTLDSLSQRIFTSRWLSQSTEHH